MGNAVGYMRCPRRLDGGDDTAVSALEASAVSGYDLEAQIPMGGGGSGGGRSSSALAAAAASAEGGGGAVAEAGAHEAKCDCMTDTESLTHASSSLLRAPDVHIGTDIQVPFKPIFASEPVGALGCNMCIIGDPETKEAVLVDPGGEPEKIIAKIKELGVTVKRILVTHAHFDHFTSAGALREFTGAPVYLHPADKILWEFLPVQLHAMRMTMDKAAVDRLGRPDAWLEDGASVGVLDGRVLHTPGHTAGSCCFYFDRSRLLIAGDTLFRGSVGRTDLSGGDAEALRKSILTRLYTLPDAVKVVCGHGPATSIGREKRSNAIIRAEHTGKL